MAETLYPWLNKVWQQLLELKQQQRLPHALLLVTQNGLGATNLSQHFLQAMLCQSPDEQGFACNECSDCSLFLAHTHPDMHHITPPEGKEIIGVDQVRSLIDVMNERAHQGGFRLALVEPADAMNKASANALLKTLEEPGQDTLLILVTNRVSSMLATVVSRCQTITVSAPSETDALDYVREHHPDNESVDRLAVRLAQNRPLLALQLLQDGSIHQRMEFFAYLTGLSEGKLEPIKLVERSSKEQVLRYTDWLLELLLDVERYQQGVSLQSLLCEDQKHLLLALSEVSAPSRYSWQNSLLEYKRLLISSSNVNPQLIVEDMMIRWIAFFR